MKLALYPLIIIFSFLGCTSQNSKKDGKKHDATVLGVTGKTADTSTKINSASAIFTYNDARFFEIHELQTKVFLYEGNLVIQLLKDAQEINFSLGGPQLYSQKPYNGNFATKQNQVETTALLSLHIQQKNEAGKEERVEVPMLFGGKATLISFNKEHLVIEINAKGGFYSDMENPKKWKPFAATIEAKYPEIAIDETKLNNLFY